MWEQPMRSQFATINLRNKDDVRRQAQKNLRLMDSVASEQTEEGNYAQSHLQLCPRSDVYSYNLQKSGIYIWHK